MPKRPQRTRHGSVLSTEDQLALAIEALEELVVLFDADDRIVIANRAWRELNKGVAETTQPGVRFEDHLRAAAQKGPIPEAIGRVEEWVAERMRRHRNPTGPFEVARQDGRWIRVSEQRLPNNGTILIISDVTEFKQAQAALRDSEERFRAVVNNSPAKIHIKDLAGRYVLVNPLAAKLFGVNEAEACGKTAQGVLGRQQSDAFREHDQAVLESGQPIEREENWVQEDGVRTYLVVKFPIFDSNGRISGIGAIGPDITERKRAEEALANLKHRNDPILSSAGEGIYGIGLDGRTTFVNPAAAKMTGWEPDELIGRMQHNVLHHTRTDGSPYPWQDCRIRKSAAYGTAQHVTDEVFWRRDGSSFPVEYVSTPIYENGKVTGAVVVFRDVSEQRRVHDAVISAKEQAEIANRAKSEFLANMSHELRTPLNAILGFSEIIKQGDLISVCAGKIPEYAGDIHASALHLLSLINDILDMSKIESGTGELEDDTIELGDVIRFSLMMVEGRATENGIVLQRDIAADLPPLRADLRKLKQVLVNLLSNGIKFTNSGGTVTLRVHCDAATGHVFEIIDTGIGIAAEDIPKALAPFQQIDSQLNRKYQGTGLGLPLSKAIVERHGGILELRSEVGVGTTVTARFPAERIVAMPSRSHRPPDSSQKTG